MPDLIASYEGEFAMAANVERGHPWHRLGHQVQGDMGIKHALKVSNSDDIVYPATLFTVNDDGTYEEVEGYMGVKSNKYGTVGVHRPGYQIKQRSEIMELAYDIAGLDPDGAHIDTVGNLATGPTDKPTVFFTYIRVPELVIDPNGIADTIERGLFAATSFDGSISNVIGYSSIRVVCWNTLQMAMKGGQVIKAKHTLNADERLNQAARALGWASAQEKQIVEKAEKMLKAEGKRPINLILDHFYPIESGLSDAGKSRRENIRASIMTIYNNERNVKKVGDNGWAAFNAFAEYIDHESGVKVKDGGKQRAMRAVLPGKFSEMKIRAGELVLAS